MKINVKMLDFFNSSTFVWHRFLPQSGSLFHVVYQVFLSFRKVFVVKPYSSQITLFDHPLKQQKLLFAVAFENVLF